MRLPLQNAHHAVSRTKSRGYLMLMAIVFGAIFLGIIAALTGFLLSQNRAQTIRIGDSEGLALAEAGLEYYHWHLAHFPADLENGTGQPGPYTLTYNDPETGVKDGTATLSIVGNMSCSQITSIDITSKGVPSDNSNGSATLVARYAKPTVALYAYVLNSSDWADSTRNIDGPYHTNGGVRMDAAINAPVTSSLSTWQCTPSFGCTPTTTEDGIWGTGDNQNLWSYPTPQVDFGAIAADFTSLKTTAKSSGIYLPRISSGTTGSNAGEGYHLVFNSNGTVTIYKVTKETDEKSIPIDNPTITTLQDDYSLINTQSLYNDGSHPTGVYTLPANCGLIFVEDNTWIEGAIPSQVTVVAANVTTTGVTPNIYIPNNITYSNASGVSGLTMISSNDILITPNSPTNLTINGVIVAQGGAFGRNLYPCTESPYNLKGILTIHGTTVANKRSDTLWEYNGLGCGNTIQYSGYTTRYDSFDRELSTNPPPFTPDMSTTYEFVDWRQE